MSEKPSSRAKKKPSLDGDQVRAYLEAHEGFFLDHPELLEKLQLPARDIAGGSVEDFQSHALERLRVRIAKLDKAQSELMDVARSNASIQSRIHQAALAAIDAHDLDHLVHVVTADWVDILDVDVVSICLEDRDYPILPSDNITLIERADINALLGTADAVLLKSGVKGYPLIFGAAAKLVRAEALVGLTLSMNDAKGLLAFGCRDARAFAPGQGTELLRFLGHILERMMRRWMVKSDG